MQKYMVMRIVSGVALIWLGYVGYAHAMNESAAAVAVVGAAAANINALDADGNTQLHTVVRAGDLEGARQLLGKGADPNVCDAENNPPLHYACVSEVSEDPAVRAKQRELVQLLYLAGADTWLRKVKGAGRFCLSDIKVWIECDENVHAIFEAGVADRIAQLNSHAFDEQSGVQNHPMKSRLIKLYELEDAYRLTQHLLTGCRDTMEKKVIRALYLGADVNSACRCHGKTALHLIAEASEDGGVEVKWNSERIAQLLLDCRASASVNAQAHDGTTPLHLAVKFKKHELVWLLLGAGADITIRDNDGKTPLALTRS